MTSDREWAELRTDVLKGMLALMQTWSGNAEEAVTIIAENQKNMDQLKTIEKKLSEEASFEYTPTERQLLTLIIPQQQQMMAAIRKEKVSLMNKMKQINQKNKVRDNYVSVQRESVFVDRGI